MSNKKYFLVLMTLLLIASCSKKEEVLEVTTEVQKEAQVIDSGNPTTPNTDTETTNTEAPAPIPVSTKTEEGIQTKFVEPTSTKLEGSSDSANVSPKTVKLEQTYKSPGGENTVAFSITTQDGKILGLSTTPIKADDASKNWEKKFHETASVQLVGKSLEEAKNIGVIAGASLTTAAFKEALKSM